MFTPCRSLLRKSQIYFPQATNVHQFSSISHYYSNRDSFLTDYDSDDPPVPSSWHTAGNQGTNTRLTEEEGERKEKAIAQKTGGTFDPVASAVGMQDMVRTYLQVQQVLAPKAAEKPVQAYKMAFPPQKKNKVILLTFLLSPKKLSFFSFLKNSFFLLCANFTDLHSAQWVTIEL